ncbi:MAG: nucleotidyltransferase domain-containing protein [Anaerolineae bacterium]
MIDLTSQRQQYVEALEHDLHSLVQQLSAMPAVRKVVLFGSYAAGRRDLLTDLDLLVVMDSSLGFVERSLALARQLSAGVALDLLVYTPEELEQMSDNPFLHQVLGKGKVLYEAHA